PVDAPDGTAARPTEPSSSTTSTSTVGLPRLSSISRPTISMIAVIQDPLWQGLQSELVLANGEKKKKTRRVEAGSFLWGALHPVGRDVGLGVRCFTHLGAIGARQFADVVDRCSL